MTRRGLQIALGFLWLLDGGLQLQPFMLGTGFARQIVTVSADGQPQFVAVPMHWAADVIAAHPVAWDVPFATVQLLIGVGLLVPRTAALHRQRDEASVGGRGLPPLGRADLPDDTGRRAVQHDLRDR